MKKTSAIVITAATSLVAIPLGLVLYGTFSSSPYKETFYAELVPMVEKLDKVEGKKIVIVGNSNVPFGVNSALLTHTLNGCGFDYEVVNFGLYGSIGTKVMMELSLPSINEGDIVLFTPEINEQSFSLYFSALETYRALDGNIKYASRFSNEERSSMVGSYTSFLSEKVARQKEGISETGTVYAKSSFDDNCDLTNFDRPYNKMPNGFDSNNMVSFDISLLSDSFVNYVNEYANDVRSKGASIYYTPSPINEECVTSTSEEIDSFVDALTSKFSFPTISNPHHYILEKEWFYDTNFHLNNDGMIYRTRCLFDDLANLLKCAIENPIPMPTMPDMPDEDLDIDGDNSDQNCFVYGDSGNIIGLSDIGKTRKEITIPSSYNGKAITTFDKSLFNNDAVLEKLTVQRSLNFINDESFVGCSNLKGIYFRHKSPSEISVGYYLLNGADNALLYVKEAYKESFTMDYTWGYYASKIKSY